MNNKLMGDVNFVNPFYNEGVGRRTGWVQKKAARTDSEGFEIFDDYWSDSDQSSLSVDSTTIGKEKKTTSKAKNVITPNIRKSSPLKPMSSFSSGHFSSESDKPNKSTITPEDNSQNLTPKAVQDDPNGSISVVDTSNVPNSALQSFKTKKRLTYSAAKIFKNGYKNTENYVLDEPITADVEARHQNNKTQNEEDHNSRGSDLDNTLVGDDDDADLVVNSVVTDCVKETEGTVVDSEIVTGKIQSISHTNSEQQRSSVAGSSVNLSENTHMIEGANGNEHVDSDFVSFKKKSVINSTEINFEVDEKEEDDDDFDIIEVNTSVYKRVHDNDRKSRLSKSANKNEVSPGNDSDGLKNTQTRAKVNRSRKKSSETTQVVESMENPAKSVGKTRNTTSRNKILTTMERWNDEDSDEELSVSSQIKTTTKNNKGKKSRNKGSKSESDDFKNGDEKQGLLPEGRTKTKKKKKSGTSSEDEALEDETTKTKKKKHEDVQEVTTKTYRKKKSGTSSEDGGLQNETTNIKRTKRHEDIQEITTKTRSQKKSGTSSENEDLQNEAKNIKRNKKHEEVQEITTKTHRKTKSGTSSEDDVLQDEASKAKRNKKHEDIQESSTKTRSKKTFGTLSEDDGLQDETSKAKSNKKHEDVQEITTKTHRKKKSGTSSGDDVLQEERSKVSRRKRSGLTETIQINGQIDNESESNSSINEVDENLSNVKSTGGSEMKKREKSDTDELVDENVLEAVEPKKDDLPETSKGNIMPKKSKHKSVSRQKANTKNNRKSAQVPEKDNLIKTNVTEEGSKEKSKRSSEDETDVLVKESVALPTNSRPTRYSRRTAKSEQFQYTDAGVVDNKRLNKMVVDNKKEQTRNKKAKPSEEDVEDLVVDSNPGGNIDDPVVTVNSEYPRGRRKKGKSEKCDKTVIEIIENEEVGNSQVGNIEDPVVPTDSEHLTSRRRKAKSEKFENIGIGIIENERLNKTAINNRQDRNRNETAKTSEEGLEDLVDNSPVGNIEDSVPMNSKPRNGRRRKAKSEKFRKVGAGISMNERLNKTTMNDNDLGSGKVKRSRHIVASSVEAEKNDVRVKPAGKGTRKKSKSLYNPESALLDEVDNSLETSNYTVMPDVIINSTNMNQCKPVTQVKKKATQRKSSVRFSLGSELSSSVETNEKSKPRKSILKSSVSPKPLKVTEIDSDDDDDDDDDGFPATESCDNDQMSGNYLNNSDVGDEEEFENDLHSLTNRSAMKRRKAPEEGSDGIDEANSPKSKQIRKTPIFRKKQHRRKNRPDSARQYGIVDAQHTDFRNQTDILAHSQFGDVEWQEEFTKEERISDSTTSEQNVTEESGSTNGSHAPNMTLKFFEVPRKKAFIIDPEQSEDGVRRTKRHRVKPLEYWRNERAIYERRKSGGFALSGIQSPTIPTPSPLKEKRKVRRKMPQTPHNLSVHMDLSNIDLDELEEHVNPTVTVVNPNTNEEVNIDAVKTSDMNHFFGQTGKPATVTDPIAMSKCLYQKSFSAGELLIRPLQEKGVQIVRNDTMVFRILRGKLAVTIHETTNILESGAMFFIPQGNVYNIKNLRNDEAKLVFVQVKSIH